MEKVGTRRHVVRSWEHLAYVTLQPVEKTRLILDTSEFSMVEMQQAGKRVQETETGDGSGFVCPSQEI